ncbi:hypothetical protein DOT66_23480 [Ralstonia pseudosolanacearum]|uniref:GIN domain-containing protein n=1 Tax=Ralstonia pseudosolanacearum TaxID=1310165 RepID=UPI000DAC69FD|nr:DUF2807 domain-containing protein [Ralstonia pseudosolanacearum]AZU59734.1 hypothetical protein CFM90_26270 [Ralstonia solanacearum]RAA04976.1 hypothetical protein DOT66_23480 [Ralstonia pseudosolanacearum]
MNNAKGLVLQGQRIDIGRNGRVTLHGNGRPAAEVRAIDGAFRVLIVHGAFQVHVVHGDAAEAVIIGDENLLQLVALSVGDDVLMIELVQNVSYASAQLLQIRLRVPKLMAVRQFGAGSVTLTDLQQDGLAIEISGKGTVTAAGQVDTVLLCLPGAGSIDTLALQAAHVAIYVDGTGEVEAFASTSAKVRVSSVGNVRVLGQPTDRDTQCGPAGTIEFPER